MDPRVYLSLEARLISRLVKDWRRRSEPLYAQITAACQERQWDRARALVPELDLTETGTSNREWIKYLLLSFAVWGAKTVAPHEPSFVGTGSFETLLNQVTGNILQYLELDATQQVQTQALQLIAHDQAEHTALKGNPWHDEYGRFTTKDKGVAPEKLGPPRLADDVVRGSDEMYAKLEADYERVREDGLDYRKDEYDFGAALQSYQGGQYLHMNMAITGQGYKEEFGDDVKVMQKMLKDAPPMIHNGKAYTIPVWRGMAVEPDKAEQFLQKMSPGTVMKMGGFQSASFTPSIAAKFLASSGGVTGRKDWSAGIMMEIEAKKGVYIGSGEQEFLMPHNSNYVVLGVKDVPFYSDGQLVRKKILQLRQM